MMPYIDDSKRAGWDDLYEDCFEEINKIIEDNLRLKHNKELIEKVFSKMIKALDKAILRMKKFYGSEKEKKLWFTKAKNVKKYSKIADNNNKKVIAINMIDQFLRATY